MDGLWPQLAAAVTNDRMISRPGHTLARTRRRKTRHIVTTTRRRRRSAVEVKVTRRVDWRRIGESHTLSHTHTHTLKMAIESESDQISFWRLICLGHFLTLIDFEFY